MRINIFLWICLVSTQHASAHFLPKLITDVAFYHKYISNWILYIICCRPQIKHISSQRHRILLTFLFIEESSAVSIIVIKQIHT